MKKSGSRSTRPVAIWLFVGVLMIIVQIVLGGITRLTDSGLSITEWKPLLGAVPPTTDAAWNEAFEKYKGIAQYKHLNSGFTLSDFKSIYFWEWLHRDWGRLIGVVFLIPFIIFLVQKRIRQDMIIPMIILFLLGGLQAAIGWIMVKSGLNDEDLYVSHIRLAGHFIAALGLLVYTFWLWLRFTVSGRQHVISRSSKKLLGFITASLVVQLVYGAFMAGLKAAQVAPTWPDINGYAIPPMTAYRGENYAGLSSFVNNPITVHFIHRGIAYLLALLVIIWTIRIVKRRGSAMFNRIKWWPVVLVLLQVVLGIITVLTSEQKTPQRWAGFEWNALTHQFTAILLLLSLTACLYLYSRPRNAAV